MVEKYKSPIRLFEALDIHVDDIISHPNKFKKIIQAEFASSADGFIVVNDITYNKQEILSLLNDENVAQLIDYHFTIWNNKGLLSFLENDLFDTQNCNWNFLNFKSGIKDWIAPYFAQSFISVSRFIIQKNDLELLASFMSTNNFIADTYTEAAHTPIINYINEQFRIFKNLNVDVFVKNKSIIEPWLKQEWYHLFNRLPILYDGLVDDFVRKLTDFLVDIQHVERKHAIHIAYNLSMINNLEFDLQELTLSNYNALKNTNAFTDPTNKKSGNRFYLTYIGIIAFVLIKLLGSTDTCNEKNNYDYHHSDFPTNNSKVFHNIEYDKVTQLNLINILDSLQLRKTDYKNAALNVLDTSIIEPYYCHFIYTQTQYKNILITNNLEVGINIILYKDNPIISELHPGSTMKIQLANQNHTAFQFTAIPSGDNYMMFDTDLGDISLQQFHYYLLGSENLNDVSNKYNLINWSMSSTSDTGIKAKNNNTLQLYFNDRNGSSTDWFMIANPKITVSKWKNNNQKSFDIIKTQNQSKDNLKVIEDTNSDHLKLLKDYISK